MTHTSHTKLAFNNIASNKTASHFLTNIKSIGIYSLLVTMFGLFTMTASITPAQAELVDLSSPEPVIQFAGQDASWLRPPNFDQVVRSMDKRLINCTYYIDGDDLKPCGGRVFKMVFSLSIVKQGSIRSVKVIESSGMKTIDAAFARELKRARFKPFLIKGKAVAANIKLPIVFTAP
ncbi:TonB family protein [Psychrobacter sp. NG25]|uniref:energy transducer TonB n=1 Tax=Psychrobacter sp. NG25 TaxID=2782005 RepID=UPI001883915F|nr:energy transducer TonB [Psychrobacter sp. NG25]MBF0657213.1 TonB family protein [Psychrobacter sp. NG25]